MNNPLYHKRISELNNCPVDENGNCVIYWMQRSQRTFDNLALDFAVNLANSLHKPLITYFGIYEDYPMGSPRVFDFMIQGLNETFQHLKEKNIGFVVEFENPSDGIVKIANEMKACAVVVDEDYVRIGRQWRQVAADRLNVRFIQVDADTVVPLRNSDKEEWGAYTIRPKIKKVLEQYFVETPEVIVECSVDWGTSFDKLRMKEISSLNLNLKIQFDVPGCFDVVGGYSEAIKKADEFIDNKLANYPKFHNEIGLNITSDLSPYLHFGQISPLRVALMVDNSDAPIECKDAFLEQLIVRRELAINFCFYNSNYDLLDAASNWARTTLEAHRYDERPELYSLEELEQAQTTDELWNTAQIELVKFGKIHNYMRMVWAKKIMEWSPSPEEALLRAIYLNDKYALDGRDPNGYANIAWCIFAKHDRPFAERKIFGKVRYMSTASTKKKTNWQEYVKRVI